MESEHLLTDAQMQRFITDGYITVQADFANGFHERLFQDIEQVFDKEKNPGNNILPRLPQIQQVFDHPTVQGALTSILGPNYLMNPHRHCHLNPPGSPGQRWHKDNYVFDEIIRHPRPRWVLAFYYPQDVTEDMGPSAVIPGRQYCHHISHDQADRTTETAAPVCGPAGTVAIVHYDSWHRAAANRSNKNRYMLKFLFERMEEPTSPTWNHRAWDWAETADDPFADVHADVWHWLSGRGASLRHAGARGNGHVPSQAAASELLAQLDDPNEDVRLSAAYRLGQQGEAAVPMLVDALRAQAVQFADQIAAQMPGNPRGSNPATVPAAHGLAAIGLPAVLPLCKLLAHQHWCVRVLAADTLGNIGLPVSDIVPALTKCLTDEHHRVRRHAAETLGRMGAIAEPAVPELIATLSDSQKTVRHNAALALAKIGLPVDDAVPALVGLLNDEDRYIRHFAGVALRSIGTPAAQSALLDALFTSRWCPITTPENMY